MTTIDLRKVRSEYTAKKTPEIVEIPTRQFLMIDGAGDPNTADEYRHAIEALYPLAYALRAEVKTASGDAYVVMPLEGLWWAEDMRDFHTDDKSNWLWTAMIGLPDAVTSAMVQDTLPAVTKKKQLVAGDRVRVAQFAEGRAAQVLHIGPYAAEAPTIEALHQFIARTGYQLSGKHHEIYLSDPRRADPWKLRTIIRQPFSDA
ncbi:MAG: hypothetical protein HKN03_02405 [Acidimicrobiales bacterium]|nr:hypothetical protein [Acidimicrobiales bacterium]